ncbi:MAG TPA: hypothetical protein VFA26_25595 [Gemmataceae bacterium]|nr:hypothetical protein [Gemmataceae bacterium]
MSITPNPAPADIPGLESVSPPPPRAYRRHALGLPAGSIRALLASLVFALLAAILIGGYQKDVPLLYNYLWYLFLLIVAHFFAAHGSTIGGHVSRLHPWGLPRGFFRFVLIAGFVALIAWLWYNRKLFEAVPEVSPGYPLVLLAGFFLGVFVSAVVRWFSGGNGSPFWFQDIQAWVALIAIAILAVEMVVVLFINPSVRPELRIESFHLEGALAAVVGFYFGARS